MRPTTRLRKTKFLRGRGYTLIEVMMAISVLLIGVAAAAQLSLTMRKQEEGNANIARALNLVESAHRLFQLGLSAAEVTALLPYDPAVTISSSTSTLNGPTELNNLEALDWTATCTVIPGQSATRDFTVKSVRESIR